MKSFIILAAALCLTATACSDGMDSGGSVEIPPVYEMPDPPIPSPVETPAPTPDAVDDDHPQIGPVEDPHYSTRPELQAVDGSAAQINPCLLHPEDC